MDRNTEFCGAKRIGEGVLYNLVYVWHSFTRTTFPGGTVDRLYRKGKML